MIAAVSRLLLLILFAVPALAQYPGTTPADLTQRDHSIHWPTKFDPITANVFSHNELVIDAPCEHVFSVMTDVAHWPTWLILSQQSHIDGADKTLKLGTLVHMTLFHSKIDTTITEYVPNSRLAWSPRALTEAKAQHYHNWLFVPAGLGCRVITEESGISADDARRTAAGDTGMHRAHDLWLASLKFASEPATAHPPDNQ